MASTNKTANYDLSQFTATDKPAWIADYNQDMYNIDAGMKANADADASINATIETLSKKVDTVSATSQTNSTNISTNTSDITDLKTKVAGNTASIEDSKGEISQNATDIATVRTNVDNNSSDIASIKNTLGQSIDGSKIAGNSIPSSKLKGLFLKDGSLNDLSRFASINPDGTWTQFSADGEISLTIDDINFSSKETRAYGWYHYSDSGQVFAAFMIITHFPSNGSIARRAYIRAKHGSDDSYWRRLAQD